MARKVGQISCADVWRLDGKELFAAEHECIMSLGKDVKERPKRVVGYLSVAGQIPVRCLA
jgi:hypothetical protein